MSSLHHCHDDGLKGVFRHTHTSVQHTYMRWHALACSSRACRTRWRVRLSACAPSRVNDAQAVYMLVYDTVRSIMGSVDTMIDRACDRACDRASDQALLIRLE